MSDDPLEEAKKRLGLVNGKHASESTNGKPSRNGKPALRIAAPPPAPAAAGDPDDPESLFNDTDRLHELATWRVYDEGRYAAEEARLKKRGVSLRRLDQVTSKMAAAIKAAAIRAGNPAARPDRQPYFVAGHVTYKAGSPTDVPLCNFTARIVADVTTDDGAECRRRLRLVGRLHTGEELPEVEVPAERFAGMDWPMTEWGTAAVVSAGSGSKDHLRAAILTLSRDVRRETVYAHTGWREVGGRWVYLHAGGAVGADGPAAGVRVALPPQLARFTLPDPPAGERLREAVRASLGLLCHLAPDEVAFPLLIAPFRAVVGGADYALGLVGRTGAGKSELAALAQQHFGAGLDARHLPANWSSTANATEALAFAAKDALLVVDDYCPAGQADAAKLQAAADRLIRGQGNHAGRSRMTAGAEVRAGKPPRGLLLVTGEDLPGGASLRARLWTMEVSAGSVDFDRLTECQRDAAAGRYAEALAGFARWLAADYQARRDRLRAEVDRRRAELAGRGGHARVPTTAADLLATLELVLTFATAAGAVHPDEAERLRARGRSALLATAAAQAEHQRDADPAGRFVTLLGSVLSSGRAHLVDRETGTRPSDDVTAVAAGWRKDGYDWKPQGPKVGWVDGCSLLDPDAAFAVVTRLAEEQGARLTIGQRTLWKQLHEAGHLAETKGAGQWVRYKVPRSVEGRTLPVIVVRSDRIFEDTSAAGEGGIPE